MTPTTARTKPRTTHETERAGGRGLTRRRAIGGVTLLPWLLLGMGSFSNVFQGKTPNPLIGIAGLLVFNSLYVSVVFRAFDERKRQTAGTRWSLAVMALLTCGLSAGYGGSWLTFFPLTGLATGAVLRGRPLAAAVLGLSAVGGVIAVYQDGLGAVGVVYGTLLSGMVTAAILALSRTVRELGETRQELARAAVERERLRFSRDLHDLLGHTLSVIVVKSEAARRLAPRDVEAALAQVADIESIGRQALVEIREAVTGYREASLAGELDRARGVLTAAGIEPAVRQSGPPLPPRTAALLGWVVRESVTNVIRHSGARSCGIEVRGGAESVRLVITDDGGGRVRSDAPGGTPAGGAPAGSGLTGLAERLAVAGGTLVSGPAPDGHGFRVTAELPLDEDENSDENADENADSVNTEGEGDGR